MVIFRQSSVWVSLRSYFSLIGKFLYFLYIYVHLWWQTYRQTDRQTIFFMDKRKKQIISHSAGGKYHSHHFDAVLRISPHFSEKCVEDPLLYMHFQKWCPKSAHVFLWNLLKKHERILTGESSWTTKTNSVVCWVFGVHLGLRQTQAMININCII